MEALAAASHAEDRRHSPWMDPADGLDRLERGLYAYNMKRLFKEGLKLQRSLAAAPAPRLSPNAPNASNDADGAEGAARGGGGGGGSEWATLVGRRIDAGRCRVVGAGATAARALGTNAGGAGPLQSVDALVHSVFVGRAADEDEHDARVHNLSGASLEHVAAPVEMCRGEAADSTVVYRLSRRHAELAVSRATRMGYNVCFHEAVAAESGGSLEGDYDVAARPPPPSEGTRAPADAAAGPVNVPTAADVSDATTPDVAAAAKEEAGEGGGGKESDSEATKTNAESNAESRSERERVTSARDARWRQHVAVYSAFHRSALVDGSAEDARYLVLVLPPAFDLRREAARSFVSTVQAGEGASVSGLAAGRGGSGHTTLRPPSGAPFNLLLSAGLLALLSNRVLLVDFSRAPRLKALLASPDGIDWDVDHAVARGHDPALLRPTRGEHPEHAGVVMDGGGGGRGGRGGVGAKGATVGSGSARWLCHSRGDAWGAEVRAGQVRRLCSAAEKEALRTRDVRNVLGGIGGAAGHAQDADDGSGGGGGSGFRSVVLDTEEVEGSLWRLVCGGGPAVLAKPGAHKMKVRTKSKAKKTSKEGNDKAGGRAKAQSGGWADEDDPGVVSDAGGVEAEAPLAPNPNHAEWCRELFGDSLEAVGGRLFSWLVRPAGPLKTAVQSYFQRLLQAGYTVGFPSRGFLLHFIRRRPSRRRKQKKYSSTLRFL